jgi:ribonuclease G
MTRQNVTDGPREIMTKKCPTCGGDGIVLSETSAAVEIERRLRALAGASRHQAYRVEVAAKVASILIGPGASRLLELEKQTRRRFYLQPKQDTHLDHFLVLAEGKREELAPAAPVAEGAKIELKLVEVGLHDANAGVGKLDGLDICVANAAKQVGKKVEVQIERVLDDAVYATLVSQAVAADEPITAESEAEKPTRRSASATAATPAKTAELDDPELEDEDEEDEPEADELGADEPDADEPEAEAVSTDGTVEPAAPKKKTRRGSRGGRGRKKKTAAAPAAAGNGTGEPEDVAPPAAARIHVPAPDLGEPDESPDEPAGDGTEPPRPKKKTRRGTRGGRGRKKKTAAAVAATGTGGTEDAAGLTEVEQPAESAEIEEKPSDAEDGKKPSDWEYVPMSEWDDLPRA